MDIRTIFMVLGAGLLLVSWYLGDWAIYLGAPLVFLAISFSFIDIS